MKKYLPWLAAAAIITVIFGTIFVVAQQAQRRLADEPQIQLAEDAAAKLDAGAKPPAVVGDRVDMDASLAPFVIVYDKNGAVVAGSGYLSGHIPQVPAGVLKAANGKAYHRVTWEPTDGVRLAAVSVTAKNSYVLSGRSLTEIEKTVTQSLQLTVFGWVVSIAVLGLAYAWQKHL